MHDSVHMYELLCALELRDRTEKMSALREIGLDKDLRERVEHEVETRPGATSNAGDAIAIERTRTQVEDNFYRNMIEVAEQDGAVTRTGAYYAVWSSVHKSLKKVAIRAKQQGLPFPKVGTLQECRAALGSVRAVEELRQRLNARRENQGLAPAVESPLAEIREEAECRAFAAALEELDAKGTTRRLVSHLGKRFPNDEVVRSFSQPEIPKRKPKVSTSNGDALEKFSAGLSQFHGYDSGQVERWEPAGCGEFAKRFDISKSQVSVLFKKYFGCHANYAGDCRRRSDRLVAVLKKLNREA